MSDAKAKPFKVKKGFDFIRDLQEQNEGRDRITYRKIANALQGNFVLGEDFAAWLKSEFEKAEAEPSDEMDKLSNLEELFMKILEVLE